jgi:hypothetical protein
VADQPWRDSSGAVVAAARGNDRDEEDDEDDGPFGPGVTPIILQPEPGQSDKDFRDHLDRLARSTGLPVGTTTNDSGETETVLFFMESGFGRRRSWTP